MWDYQILLNMSSSLNKDFIIIIIRSEVIRMLKQTEKREHRAWEDFKTLSARGINHKTTQN